jgi:hypothetical protein
MDRPNNVNSQHDKSDNNNDVDREVSANSRQNGSKRSPASSSSNKKRRMKQVDETKEKIDITSALTSAYIPATKGEVANDISSIFIRQSRQSEKGTSCVPVRPLQAILCCTVMWCGVWSSSAESGTCNFSESSIWFGYAVGK